MTDMPNMEDIRNSIAYQTAYEALNRVFGTHWQVADLTPGDVGNDFNMSIRITGFPQLVYVSGVRTFHNGQRSPSFGFISINVPTPKIQISRIGENNWVSGIIDVAGTTEQKKRFAFGSSGSNPETTEEYFQILKSYLDAGAPQSQD